MLEPRMHRGRPRLSVQQKVNNALSKCVHDKPTNGLQHLGPCLCHKRWQVQVSVPGHGQVRLGRLLLFLAGRITEWQLWHSQKHVLHLCRNEFCLNVDHLYLGDEDENSGDAIRDKSHPMVLTRGQLYFLWKEWFKKKNHNEYALLHNPRLFYSPRGPHHPLAKKRVHISTLQEYVRGEQQQIQDIRIAWFKKNGLVDPYV